MRRACLSILLLGGALGAPFRPALRGLGPVYFVPAVRRRGGVAPRAVSSADVSEKGELLDAASRLMGSVEPPDAHTAGSVIDQLIDHPLNEEEYARLISLSGHAGNWQLSVQLLRDMEERGLLPTASAHLAALWACARAGQWPTAFRLLEEMELYGLPNILGAFTAAASACREAGEWQEAIALLGRARAQGVLCDRFLYMHVVDACAEAGKHEEAMQTYAQGVEAGALVHWREDEPFSIDVHGFSQHSAVCAVRYALRHEIGNFMSADLKIITGLGRHSTDGAPLLLPRIERLLTDEFQLRYEYDAKLVCNERDCKTFVNMGCLVVQLQELFRFLSETKPFETYVVTLPEEVG